MKETNLNFDNYKTGSFYDELFDESGQAHLHSKPLIDQINALSHKDLRRRQKAAELALHQLGITFSVYGDKKGTEKIFPFDVIPRVIPASEWQNIENGLKQRIEALNLFVDDIYHDKKILKVYFLCL